jgi:hypothetical protein
MVAEYTMGAFSCCQGPSSDFEKRMFVVFFVQATISPGPWHLPVTPFLQSVPEVITPRQSVGPKVGNFH